ncbi:phage recombination protein Bet [Streptococcus sp. E17BB]|uniref:phage recombination protein Bet n=1 Tax=Streptococcus sp. E17BB TaxID=3278714 RepID=UPI00359D9804
MTQNQLTAQPKRDIAVDTSVWTPQDIKRFFDPQNLLSEKQVGQALSLIKGRNLNPLANEVYIVAYKNNKTGGVEFSLIVSKEAFLKRAAQSPNYEGFEAGVVVIDENGIQAERKGSLILPTDKLVGGWARVYRKNFKVPVEIYLSLAEYNKGKSTWNSMPATMIRKTALVNALREAFPEDLGNMYTEDDGGEAFDRVIDVVPEKSRDEVIAEKKAQVEAWKAQQAKQATLEHQEEEVAAHVEEPVQGELLDY